MKRSFVLLAIVSWAVAWGLPVAAEGHTLSAREAKRVLYAYAATEGSLQFRVGHCRHRSRHEVRCAVSEVFLEQLFGTSESYEATEDYTMAVKLRRPAKGRRPHSSSPRRARLLVYDDVKGGWVTWNRR